jgi:hypothetical protein
VAIRAAIREPQRPLVFALAVLIHVGLFQLLISPRQTIPAMFEHMDDAPTPGDWKDE